jgi:putative transposase
VVMHICRLLAVSERRACRILNQCRATNRYVAHGGEGEEKLVANITELAVKYGRYGYRRITALLKQKG